MTYDVLVTAVSDRSDLFVKSMESMLKYVDLVPSRILVHEDVRDGTKPGEIGKWLKCCGLDYKHFAASPARGMGPGVRWLLESAETTFALYTQEDWLFLRRVPVSRTIELMDKFGLHHVRWNKRETMGMKGDWKKVEVEFDGHVMCISDHWYTQSSMWRVEEAISGVRAVAKSSPQAHVFVPRFNDFMNSKYVERAKEDLKHVQRHGKKNVWHDQDLRHKYVKTYIWGPVAEPPYIKHIGSRRGTGHIKDHHLEL